MFKDAVLEMTVGKLRSREYCYYEFAYKCVESRNYE